MANIDYIGWMSADLYAGEKELGGESGDSTEVIGQRGVRNTPASASDRYFVDFGGSNSAAGVYLMRGNGKVYRVNGRAR